MQCILRTRRFVLWLTQATLIQFALAFVLTGIGYGTPGRAQELLNQEVSIQCHQRPLEEILAQLEANARIQFVFSAKVIQSSRLVTLNVQREKLAKVLSDLLQPMRISYEVVGNKIILNRQPERVSSPDEGDAALRDAALRGPAMSGSTARNVTAYNSVEQPISGRVTTPTGEPLPGVNVAVKGQVRGTTTDGEGQFKLAVNPGEVLVFSFIGYGNQEVIITDQTTLSVKLSESNATLQEVAVIGSRGRPRTDVDRPVPVDVLSIKELQGTGQVDLGQMVQFNSPSFNSAKTGVNGVANYADPATLRGLSPDQVLVLVDGKRRHQFSALNLNQTVGLGTVVTDLNSIPSLALDRIEVLRDGAAAQYGSDAIAGIVNLALNKSVGKGTVLAQYGVTKQGDGAGFLLAANYGFRLGKANSYLNLTGQYQHTDGTNRTDPYIGNIYNANKVREDSIRRARGVWPVGQPFKVGIYGSNETDAIQGFYNAGFPLSSEWSLYSFGGYSRKDILAYGFFRNATPTNANSNTDIFPDGYLPELPGTSVDYSTVVGLSRKVLSGWNLDLSTGYGYNYLDLEANNTTNPSLGAASPTNFYVGRSGFGQSTTELNLSRNYTGLWGTQSVNVALGSQFRVDQFELVQGSPESYAVGPLARTRNKAPGSSGRPGIAPEDETDARRTNVGIYADIESDITSRFLLAGALRYENYSDFGSNVSGKLATRLKLSEAFSLRGSINKGFRAPSLQQTFNSQSTSTVQAGVIVQTKQLPSNDPRVAQVGIQNPVAETSWNYNVGVTAKAGDNLLLTLDAYQIDISDRIIVSERLIIRDIAALRPLFPGISEVRFFTNHIDTRTQGIDFVASYKYNFDPKHRLTTSLAFTFNQTKIVRTKATPSALQLDTPRPILLIDTVSIGLIETAQPRQKILLSVGYQLNKVNLNVRASYFGAVTGWEKPAGRPHQKQTFSGKTLIDLAVVYNPTRRLSLSVGGNNLFDVYPDKVPVTSAAYSNGEIPYTRNANQFGFNGASYYANATLSF